MTTTTKIRREFERTAIPYLDNLHGAAMRLTRDPNEAEDLVQDTMVRAYRFWDTFKQGTNIKAWLFTILRNTFINGYHRRGRARKFEALVHGDMSSLGDLAAVARTSSAEQRSIEQAVDHRATVERIHAALEQLHPGYRMAIILADLEGLEYKEIADLLEIPIGTVMSRIYRGRKDLHALLFGHAAELGLVGDDDRPGKRVTKYTRTAVAAEAR